MTQEEKQLLSADLCARLPYGVKATTTSNGWSDAYTVTGYVDNRINLDCQVYDEGDDEWLVESVKPYLRSLSSMTEEEKKEFIDATDGELRYSEVFDVIKPMHESEDYYASFVSYLKSIDWLNAHHFDYRGLIEKGLALEAPEEMYK